MEQITAIADTVQDELLDTRDMHRQLEEIWVQLGKIEAALNRVDELRM